MVTARGFSELMPFTNTSSGTVSVGISAEWITGSLNTIAKAIDSSKNIVLHNATVGNKEDIFGKVRTHISLLRVRQDKKIIFLSGFTKCQNPLYWPQTRTQMPRSNPTPWILYYPSWTQTDWNFNFVTLDSSLPSNHES